MGHLDAEGRSVMIDLLDRTATGVRLVCASLKADVGRQYRTGCHRYLYADEGAILTTRKADRAECNGTAHA
jgi:hypothetical protein